MESVNSYLLKQILMIDIIYIKNVILIFTIGIYQMANTKITPFFAKISAHFSNNKCKVHEYSYN